MNFYLQIEIFKFLKKINLWNIFKNFKIAKVVNYIAINSKRDFKIASTSIYFPDSKWALIGLNIISQ